MNPELQKLLIDTITGLKDQLPALYQETLKFGLYNALFWMTFQVVCIAILIFSFIVLNKKVNGMKENYTDNKSASRILLYVIYSILTLITLSFFFSSIIEVIKIKSAPRTFLLDYFRIK